MGQRRWSFPEVPRQADPVSAWRFRLGLMAGLVLCGAAAIQCLR